MFLANRRLGIEVDDEAAAVVGHAQRDVGAAELEDDLDVGGGAVRDRVVDRLLADPEQLQLDVGGTASRHALDRQRDVGRARRRRVVGDVAQCFDQPRRLRQLRPPQARRPDRALP